MAVRGADEWNKDGLEECSITVDSRTEYVAEIDRVQQFIKETFYRSPGHQIPQKYVLRLYIEWAYRNGFERVPAYELYDILDLKGWKKIWTDNACFYKGFRVIEKNSGEEGDSSTSHPRKSSISTVYVDMDLLRQVTRGKQV